MNVPASRRDADISSTSKGGRPLGPGERGGPDDQLGPDYWAVSAENWFLIALDAQLFGSHLDLETEQ